jgi:hypothetical protein
MEFTTKDLKPWELDLVNKYTLIFKEFDEFNFSHYKNYHPDCGGDGTVPEDYCNLRYGFEHGPGWKELVEEWANIAQETVVAARAFFPKNEDDKPFYIHSCIVKEKFGRLCFQGYCNLPEQLNTLFKSFEHYVESKSLRTCEYTGKPGKPMFKNRWVKTVCLEKALELGYEEKTFLI